MSCTQCRERRACGAVRCNAERRLLCGEESRLAGEVEDWGVTVSIDHRFSMPF